MKKLLSGILISLLLISNVYATDGWLKAKPAGTDNASDLDSYIQQNNAALDLALSYLRQGCVLSYSSTSSLSVGAGSLVVQNSDGSIRLMLAKTSAITTNWNVAENGLDAGVEAGSTTYYVFAIASAVTDTTYTIKISTNASVPASTTYYKRLGSFYNDSNSNITQIVNDDNSGDIAFVKGQGNYYKVDSGTVTAGESSQASVSFDFTFASAPIVVYGYYPATPTSLPDHTRIELYQAPTTTGCIFYQRSGSAGTVIHWHAIGQVLAQ